jgi:hypothetical protein
MLKKELKYIVFALLIFLFFYFLPLEERFLQGLKEAVYLTHEYAREHVIFSLIPALFIAGAITTFLSSASYHLPLLRSSDKCLSHSANRQDTGL